MRQQNGTTSRYWYVLDGRGNVVALTDQSGAVVDRYAYDPRGEGLPQGTSETVPQQLRYAGYWLDSELSWYWLDGRSYDPEGRFLQPDPTALDGVHTYVYANDDPVDLVEIGGAWGFPSFGDFWGHAVAFVDSAAHVTFKIASSLWNAVAGTDIHTLCCSSAPFYTKVLAGVDLAVAVLPGADIGKLVEVGGKTAVDHGLVDLVRTAIQRAGGHLQVDDGTLLDALRERAAGGEDIVREAEQTLGCALCFPAGTLVATPHGEQTIQSLHAGDTVWAENPTTHKVEAERVQATIQDPVSPLIAVDLSDGSAITVTADHPFWVDAGEGLAAPGWMVAGHLRSGDVLRTANGTGVVVEELRFFVGHADVFTLSVAKDHTFFAGTAQVLVHNANKYCDITRFEELARNAGSPGRPNYEEAFGALLTEEKLGVQLTSSVHAGEDFIDEKGRVYDLLGPLPSSALGNFKVGDFLKQINKHLLKSGINVIPVILEGIPNADQVRILEYIDNLPPTERDKLEVIP